MRDPVLLARVLSCANAAASHSGHMREANTDIYQATSLVGIAKVRHLAAIGSVTSFVKDITTSNIPQSFQEHALCVGVCCEEIARHSSIPIPVDTALIAGLLHDIGQLWLYRFYADEFQSAWNDSFARNVGIEEIEQEYFGVSHATVGGWLAEYWSRPSELCSAIFLHHTTDFFTPEDLLPPLVHVGEVLSNALELTHRDKNRVFKVSSAACEKLGIVWDANIFPLFGRIEARSQNTLNLPY